MKKLFLFLLFALFTHYSNAQVTTRILKERESIKTYFPKHVDGNVNYIIIEKPDLDSVYSEDDRIGRQMARFAVKVNTDITEKDGKFIEQNDFVTWKIGVLSKGATSLNFKFINLHLPDGAKMFLYSSDERMIIGPIRSQNLRNGKIMTNMLYGNEAIIEVYIPKQDIKSFKLGIEFISYGITHHSIREVENRDFNESQWCINENNIICPEFADWYDLGDGVARILVNGQWWCSGSLVANECNADRPFFLTAFHCLDDFPEDGILDEDEIDNLENWCFEFNYESPFCSPSTEPSNWDTYCGARFLAGWNRDTGTDFLLLEITDPQPIFNSANTLNHTTNINDAEIACIHHPQGDIKKIATDNDEIIQLNRYWRITDYVDGLTESVSSGGPLFDANHEIIGQLWGGLTVECNGLGGSPEINDEFGRIDISWSGNGTDDTSL